MATAALLVPLVGVGLLLTQPWHADHQRLRAGAVVTVAKDAYVEYEATHLPAAAKLVGADRPFFAEPACLEYHYDGAGAVCNAVVATRVHQYAGPAADANVISVITELGPHGWFSAVPIAWDEERTVSVRGHEAHLASIGDPPTVYALSWEERPGVRVIVGANLTNPDPARKALSLTARELVDIARSVQPVGSPRLPDMPLVVGEVHVSSNPIAPSSPTSVYLVAGREGDQLCEGVYPYAPCEPISRRNEVIALVGDAGTPVLSELALGHVRADVSTVRAQYADGHVTTTRTVGAAAKLGRRFFTVEQPEQVRVLIALDRGGRQLGRLQLADDPTATTTTAPTTTASTAPPATAAGLGWTITPDGAGGLHVGMTLAEATRASGHAVTLDETSLIGPGSTCGAADVGGAPDGVRFQVDASRGEWRIQDVEVSTDSVGTAEGIKVGDAVQRVSDVYGARVRTTENQYSPLDPYLDVAVPGRSDVLMRFSTHEGRVVMIAAGARSAVTAPEGCA